MLAFSCADQCKREQAIGRFIRPLANELRSLELHLLVEQVAAGRLGNLRSVVEASSELYFRPGSLRCNQIAEVDLRWGSPPRVEILLTFASQGVIAAFVLQLDTFSIGVDLQYASFPVGLSIKQETQLLGRVLKNCRRARADDRAKPVSEAERQRRPVPKQGRRKFMGAS